MLAAAGGTDDTGRPLQDDVATSAPSVAALPPPSADDAVEVPAAAVAAPAPSEAAPAADPAVPDAPLADAPAATTTTGAPPPPTGPAPSGPPVAAAAAPPTTIAERGAAALALIRYPWEATGYGIVFAGPREGYLGLTSSGTMTITIHIRPGQSIEDIARVLGHEIGHALDLTSTTDQERAHFRAVRGLDERAWYPCSACSDYESPAGDFAEVFTWWVLGPGRFRSTRAPAPADVQLAALDPVVTLPTGEP